jgi:hypothetical protein
MQRMRELISTGFVEKPNGETKGHLKYDCRSALLDV